MNDQTTQLLEDLARKLGTTLDHVWAVLVRQAYINAITNLFWIVALGICAVAAYKAAMRLHNSYQERRASHEWDLIDQDMGRIIAGLAAFAFGFVALLILTSTISAVLNPEYWALKQVLDAIGGN